MGGARNAPSKVKHDDFANYKKRTFSHLLLIIRFLDNRVFRPILDNIGKRCKIVFYNYFLI